MQQRLIDITKLEDFNLFKVSIDGKDTQLQIGDQVVFPEDDPILKTVIAITIFEDKTVNYTLKWFDGDDFRQTNVSLIDLKLTQFNKTPKPKVGLCLDDLTIEDE